MTVSNFNPLHYEIRSAYDCRYCERPVLNPNEGKTAYICLYYPQRNTRSSYYAHASCFKKAIEKARDQLPCQEPETNRSGSDLSEKVTAKALQQFAKRSVSAGK